MNNFHQLYILTEHDEHYHELIIERQLEGLSVTNDRAQATILLAAPPMAARCLDEFPRLQWLHSAYAGVDTLMAPKLRKNYLLTNVKGIFGHLIAEYVMGYAIQHQRHFSLYQAQQAEQRWQTHSYSSLANQTMVILGTGSIGSHLAKVAKQFGLRVVGVNRTGIPAKEGDFDATYHISELPSALMRADLLVNTLPNTPATEGLLNQDNLSHCHQTLLFNVGRGKTLVEQDLPDLIAAGRIRHAFLDVFIKEPLAIEHPFWTNPAITITPHIAAVSFPEQVVDIFADNYQRWRDDLPLRNQIDFEKGY
ncbi:D-2-hydroxyacid dehydrogenase [Vibrio mimicus]|uniref:D-2-hydroxyacid dehydrogenase n=1 Tax=Vibrio mimicus TaxID=674 RepID=UPI002FF22643